MALALDRAAFFDAVRRQPFAGHLTAPQVAGMEAILAACPADLGIEKTAYCLATTFHETARRMRPVQEIGHGRGKPYGPSGFWGRGYVQLTWETNYARATTELRALGILKRTEDLVRTPALALRPDLAGAILFHGMIEGWFTGAMLADHFGPGRCDPVGARRIINGTDCAALVAGYHAPFRAALAAAVRLPGAAKAPAPPDPMAPMTAPPSTLPSPIQPAPSGGLSLGPDRPLAPAAPSILARLLTLVRDNMRKGL